MAFKMVVSSCKHLKHVSKLKIVSLEALETLLETEDRLMASISFGEY